MNINKISILFVISTSRIRKDNKASLMFRLTHNKARKTFATTVLLYNDVPMEIVSKLLGHSNMILTQDTYGKVVQKKVSLKIERLRRSVKLPFMLKF